MDSIAQRSQKLISGIPIADVHTHNQNAAGDAIINLPFGTYLPPRPDRWYSIGLHPWDTESLTGAEADAIIDKISQAATNPQIIAIGECGIDNLHGAPLEEQERIFMRHIKLSETLKKPLIVHAVRAIQPLLQLRKASKAQQLWIYHGFKGNVHKAKMLVDGGIDISLGDKYMPEVLDAIPQEHIWHETDMQ